MCSVILSFFNIYFLSIWVSGYVPSYIYIYFYKYFQTTNFSGSKVLIFVHMQGADNYAMLELCFN